MVRVEKWTNSNLSLFEEDLNYCYGIKTGITPNAGPCLASYFTNYNNEVADNNPPIKNPSISN
jgi:hypothetical protein